MNSFIKLKNFLELQIQSGISPNTPSHLEPFIRQSNINGIIFFILDLSLAPVFYLFTENYFICLSLVISGLLFLVSSVGLNKLGYSRVSRISTSIIGSLIIGICVLVLGGQSQPEITLILGAILPFTQFHLKERRELLISLIFPLIIMVILKVCESYIHPLVIIEKKYVIDGLFFIFYLSSYFGIAFNTFNNMAEHNRKAENLEKSEKHLGLILIQVRN